MTVYADVVCIFDFIIDYLLLLGTNRLCGYPPEWKRSAVAAAVGGVYSGLCLMPGVSFLGNTLWRVVVLGLLAWIAFGFSRSALRRCIVFVILSMALGGVALGLGNKSAWTLPLGAAVIFLMCFVGFRDRIGTVSYLPVELTYGDKSLRLTALEDTGNGLRDPVTGKPVLVVDAEIAQKLTGLTQQQLRSPVSSMAQALIPGLRLIPYRAVGQPSGLLLALRIPDVRIGKWKGSSLVAFAPNGVSREGAYQALTGGMV